MQNSPPTWVVNGEQDTQHGEDRSMHAPTVAGAGVDGTIETSAAGWRGCWQVIGRGHQGGRSLSASFPQVGVFSMAKFGRPCGVGVLAMRADVVRMRMRPRCWGEEGMAS